MARNVKNVKNSLKFKATPKQGVLSVRVGVKKYVIPGVEARLIAGDDYLFLSFPASSELYRLSGKKLEPMAPDQDATEAYQQLNPGKRRRKRTRVELSSELVNALKRIPPGYKLGYTADGQPRLVRTRVRRK